MRPRTLVLIAVTIILAAGVSLGMLTYYRVTLPMRHIEETSNNLGNYREAFRTKTSYLSRLEVREMRSILNDYHIAKARELGVSGLENSEIVRKAVKNGRLVLLEESGFWRINELKDSLPYVTPDTLKLLNLMGDRFRSNLKKEDLPAFRFTISSVLRTGEGQKHLARHNRNATRDVSSHEFGTTVDILFREFDYSVETPSLFKSLDRHTPLRDDPGKAEFDELAMRYTGVLKTILGRTLIELQNEGKCYVIIERRQPVFHITLASKF